MSNLTDDDIRRMRKCAANPLWPGFADDAVDEILDDLQEARTERDSYKTSFEASEVVRKGLGQENQKLYAAINDAIQFIEADMPAEALAALRRVKS